MDGRQSGRRSEQEADLRSLQGKEKLGIWGGRCYIPRGDLKQEKMRSDLNASVVSRVFLMYHL